MLGLVLLKTPSTPAPAWVARAAAERLLAQGAALEPPVSGTVYGAVLNVRGQVEQMAEAMTKPPYLAPAKAPVLYIKPPNTFGPHGGAVPVPEGVEALEVNATLAVVMGRSIGRADEAAAMEAVLGYTVAIDVCIPHASLYRPAIRQRCRDGFLPIGPWVTARAAVADPDGLEVTMSVNGERRSRFSTAELVRPVARLLSEISAFSTLHAGDVVMVGLPPDGPRARAGDTVVAEIPNVGSLRCMLRREGAA
jgi:5-oxopent-3-ene-1,2,5-tricarboxylate decarboxylase/2-hydroxyhepta-2,4-diene-1,7-dioate isomerase